MPEGIGSATEGVSAGTEQTAGELELPGRARRGLTPEADRVHRGAGQGGRYPGGPRAPDRRAQRRREQGAQRGQGPRPGARTTCSGAPRSPARRSRTPSSPTTRRPTSRTSRSTSTTRAPSSSSEITGRNIKRRFAIVLDDASTRRRSSRPRSAAAAARSRSAASGRQRSAERGEGLVVVLKAGALPAPIRPSNEQLIGPIARARTASRRACKGALVGILLVLRLHGRLLRGRRAGRGRRGGAQPAAAARGAWRCFEATADAARHRGARAHHRHGGRRQRADQRAHPRGAARRQVARAPRSSRASTRRSARSSTVTSRRSSRGAHPVPVRHRPDQGLRGHAHHRHLHVAVHRRVLLAPGVRLAGARPARASASGWGDAMEFFKPGKTYRLHEVRWRFIARSSRSSLACSASCSLFWPGPNYGIDFKGGTEIELAFKAGRPRRGAPDGRGARLSPTRGRQRAEATTQNRFLIRVQEVSSLPATQVDGDPEAPRQSRRSAPAKVDEHDQVRPAATSSSLRYDTRRTRRRSRTALARRRRAACARVSPFGPTRRPPLRGAAVRHRRPADGRPAAEARRPRRPSTPLRVEWVGPKAGKQLRDAAVKSHALAIVFIMVYVAFRFDLRFAPGGVIALRPRRARWCSACYVVLQKEITLATVAAVLTIVGYSINDTIVDLRPHPREHGAHARRGAVASSST